MLALPLFPPPYWGGLRWGFYFITTLRSGERTLFEFVFVRKNSNKSVLRSLHHDLLAIHDVDTLLGAVHLLALQVVDVAILHVFCNHGSFYTISINV